MSRMSHIHVAALAAAAGIIAFAAQTSARADQTSNATQAASIAQIGVEEVTVTARRRPESMEKVPVAVTPLSGDELRERDITSALDVQNSVPSLTVTGNLGERDADVFTIRGQGAPFGGADPGVQTYFAEVPFGAGGVGNYYDMDNIQVLKGPQGTLFGRSTTGGAILFEPKRPTDEFGGYLDAQAGNYSMYELSGAVNVPIDDDKFDLRLAGDTATRDGFTKDSVFDEQGNFVRNETVDNLNYGAFRASAIMRPFAGFENYLVFDYLRDHNNGAGAELTAVNTGTINNLANEFLGPGFCILNPTAPTCEALAGFEQEMQQALALQKSLGIRNTSSSIPLFYDRDTWGVTDIATYDFNDHLRIRNIFGYLDDKVADGFDYDGSFLPLLDVSSPLAPQSHSSQLTDEVQLQGETDNLNWILGYYHETDSPVGSTEIVRNTLGGAQPPFSPFLGFGSTEIDELTNTGTSDAAFGQATYNFSGRAEGLSLTAGGRYTWDHRVAASSVCIDTTLPDICSFPLPSVFKLPTQQADFHAPTWTLGAQYQFTPDTMLYATYRRGYKSGGFNSGEGAATSFGEFKPEFLTDVEVGTKNNWTILGVPGRTNFDIYYGWYDDVQKNDLVILEQQIPPPANPPNILIEPIALTFNAATATIKGLEFESTFIPDDNFQFSIFYSYTEANYTKFVLPEMIFIDLAGNQTTLNSIDHSGNPFANTPQHKLGLTARFHLPVDVSYGVPVISASWYYQSKVWFTDLSDLEPDAFQNGYDLLNLRLDWNNIFDSPFDASFFMNNVTNQDYKVGANALEHLIGTTASIYGPPRMWGFELRWRFGSDAR